MILRHLAPNRRSGVAAAEFALLSPVLLGLLLGTWEVGRLIHVEQIVWNAAREGARQASTGKRTVSEVQQAALTYLSNAGIPTTGVTVTVTNLTSSSRPDPTTADQLDHFRVAITVPFNNVRWVMLDQITSVTELSAAVDWLSMRDLPFNVSTNIPAE